MTRSCKGGTRPTFRFSGTQRGNKVAARRAATRQDEKEQSEWHAQSVYSHFPVADSELRFITAECYEHTLSCRMSDVTLVEISSQLFQVAQSLR